MIVLETARESGSGALVHLNCGIRFVCRNRLYTTSFDLLEVARLLRAYGVNVILHEPIAPASTAIQKLLLGTDQLPTDHEEVENVISEFYNIIIELVPVRREQELHHFQSEAKSAFENISTITKLHTRFAEALERLEQLQASRSEASPEGRRLKILRARKILLQLELQHSRRTVKQDTRATRLYAEALELIDASLQQLCRSIGDVVPPFLFGVGLLPGIRSVALECRDPVVRRKALETFRRYPVQEGVWNARRQLRVCKTIIGFEDVTPGQMVVHHQLGPEHTVLGEPDSLTIFCISTAHPPEHTVHQIPLISE
ncbi:hypothetical protein CKM354_000470100 [Cercospora kikuchii]|uniref:Uncharacterized protein n=1 Tax=Cercospora kikuchii TaxID=84275 RepID=A0A9P3CEP7_9PEZI|nr:uncharacterized protein CKM354_000470100 [Cercospora kikuchii]GIZ41396.1 hypothetical protein CKM354_000470100 [Cercospora kikuchii]